METPTTGTLYTFAFWKDAAERAVKTAAQAAALVLGGGAINVLELDWLTLGGAAGGGALLSILTSIATGSVRDTASLTRAVAPVNHQ